MYQLRSRKIKKKKVPIKEQEEEGTDSVLVNLSR